MARSSSRTILILLLSWIHVVTAAEDSPQTLETRIALADVKGRIDHLAIDVARQRLFVAALGNDTVEVIDLASARRSRSLTGFTEPQGVAYAPGTDTLYVANGGDGSLRTYLGASLNHRCASSWAVTLTTCASIRNSNESMSAMAMVRWP